MTPVTPKIWWPTSHGANRHLPPLLLEYAGVIFVLQDACVLETVAMQNIPKLNLLSPLIIDEGFRFPDALHSLLFDS